MTVPSAADVVKVQLRQAWTTARRSLDGLADAEYLWEPVSPCWSVRRRVDAERGWGAGEFCNEDAWPPLDPLPTTTIAWKVIHLAAWTDVYRGHAFGDGPVDLMEMEIPGDRAGGVAWFHRAQDRFIDRVDALTDEEIFEPRPAHWGESVPVVQLVSGLMIEHTHHLAEVGVLRDLRRGQAMNPPPPAPIETPDWWSAPR